MARKASRSRRRRRESPHARDVVPGETGAIPESKTPQNPATRAPRVPKWLATVALCLVLAIVTVVAYSNSLQAPFILDDLTEIQKQPAILPPVTFAKIVATNRPIVTASYALNYAIGGMDVTSFHVLNLVAHIVCGIAVFGFLRYTLLLPGMVERVGAAAEPLAFLGSALFLLHPVQTESVTYVSQRAEIFLSLAVILSLWASAAAIGARSRAPYVVGLVAASAFGTLSKQMFFVAPVLFALYDWCFLSRGRRVVMARHAWLYRIWLVIAVMSLVFSWQFDATTSAGFDIQEIPPWRYLAWQAGVLVYYLRLVLWPDFLCFDCGYMAPWPVYNSILGTSVVLPALFLIGLAVAAWAAHRKYPVATFGILGSAIVLAPTSSVIALTDVYVEHRLYLPIAFLAMLIVVAAFDAVLGFTTVARRPRRWFLVPTAVVAVIVCVLLARLTYARNYVYSDALRMWNDSVAKAPKSSRAVYNLANEYNRRGESEQAIARYLDVIALEPDVMRNYNNLGMAYFKVARYEEALATWGRAAELSKEGGIAYRNYARALDALGRTAEAIVVAERSMELEPRNASGRALLAGLYRKAGRHDDASAVQQEAVRMNPGGARGPVDDRGAGDLE